MNLSPVFSIIVWLVIHLSRAARIEHNGDTLLLVEATKISRMPLSTMAIADMQIANLVNAKSVDFDINRNCIFWADDGTREIRRQCGARSSEVLHKTTVGAFGRIAYDWSSELLYFTNHSHSKVEVVSSSSKMPHLHRTIANLEANSFPDGIAIHPRRGYLFWTERNAQKRIVRSNLDGSDVRTLVQNPVVHWPDLITVDFKNERILWTDRGYSQIASCDFDGKNVHVVWKNHNLISAPLSLAVLNDMVYWGDYSQNTLLKGRVRSENDANKSIETLNRNAKYIDVRAAARTIQSESSACGGVRNTCSHFCVGAPTGSHTCWCPDGMELRASGQCVCPGARLPTADGRCSPPLTFDFNFENMMAGFNMHMGRTVEGNAENPDAFVDFKRAMNMSQFLTGSA